MGCIYMIKNIINNKIYIGKTIYDAQTRWKDHLSRAKKSELYNSKLYRAINKYGAENFEVLVLEDSIFDNELLNEKEKYYIKLYDSYYKGYNSTFGGEGESKVDINKILSLYKENKLISEISEETGYNPKTVLKYLKEYADYKEPPKGYNGKKIIYNGQLFYSQTELAKFLLKTEKDLEDLTLRRMNNVITSCRKDKKIYRDKYKFFD